MFLNCHSFYSLKYGTLSIKKLLKNAVDQGCSSFALTDINNTSGCLEIMSEAPKYGIRPVLGIDFRNTCQQVYIGLARNEAGFANLNRFLSAHLHSKEDFPDRAPALEDVFFIYPFPLKKTAENTRPDTQATHSISIKAGSSGPSDTGFLHKLNDNEFIGVTYEQLNQLRFSAFMSKPEKLVALQPVTFQTRKDFNAHRLMRAMDLNTLLSKLGENDTACPDEYMLSGNGMESYFKNALFLLQNAAALINACSITFEFKTGKNKICFYDTLEEDARVLKEKALEGALFRYKTLNKTITDRIEKELDLIIKKNFVSYFLINWDIVRYARSQGFFYVGRGSGANSIIAYCLRITDVDPLDLDLYFERFINLYRENAPDFDIDFSWKDRDSIIAYVFNKYGTDHTSLLATYNTFQVNSVMRELGKVFGLPVVEIEELITFYKKIPPPTKIGELIYRYAEYLRDFPSYLSIHAGGILISEKPIYNYTATSMPPKGFPTAQFSMIEAEDIGLNKFDILSQRGLGHIREVVDIVKDNRGVDIDIHQIDAFKKDPLIARHLNKGNTMGCFYVESPAMRMLLFKLETNDYLGLVAASSIIRPGVAQSGMMRQYILLHKHPEYRNTQHPVMLSIMPETYGVMVYQEDVIKVANIFAGLDLGQADVLRRGMSGKYRSRDEFQRIKDQYYLNCKEKGYTEELAREIWRQIESFAGYSFAKGHSASFAVESYQSLYLKTYFPLEFMVGVINNFGGFYRTEFYVHEARINGATIEAPCVNNSRQFTSIKKKVIHLGFVHIDSLEKRTVTQLLNERESGGLFQSFDEFLQRVAISLEQILLLIRINAFRFTGKTKQELMWEAHFIINKRVKVPKGNELFPSRRTKKYALPSLDYDSREDMLDQLDLLGFTIEPAFKLLANQQLEGIRARDLKKYHRQQVQIIGQLVTLKPTRTVKGEGMYFGTFVDQEGQWIDTVHFPPMAKKYPVRGSGCYLIRGKVAEEFGYYSLEVNYLERLGYWNREDSKR